MPSPIISYKVAEISSPRLYKVLDARTKAEAISLGVIDYFIDLFMRFGQKKRVLGELYDMVNSGVSQERYCDPLYFHPVYRTTAKFPPHGFLCDQQLQKLSRLQTEISDSPHHFNVSFKELEQSPHGRDYQLQIYHNGESIAETLVTRPLKPSFSDPEYVRYMRCASFILAFKLNESYRQSAHTPDQTREFLVGDPYVQNFVETFIFEEMVGVEGFADYVYLIPADITLENGKLLRTVVTEALSRITTPVNINWDEYCVYDSDCDEVDVALQPEEVDYNADSENHDG